MNVPKISPESTIPGCGAWIRSIYFYMTEGCNLRCRHCWIKPPFEKTEKLQFPYIDLKTFKHIIDQALDMGLILAKLTGGEPLIHPEIEEILDYISQKQLQLDIETNGTVLTPKLAKKIVSNSRGCSLSISIDSHVAETHEWVRQVPGSLEAAKDGVRYMVEAGYRPQVIMSVMRRNRNDIRETVALAKSLNAASIKFNPVLPSARGEALHKQEEALSIKEVLMLGQWIDRELQPVAGIPLRYSMPPVFRPVRNFKHNPSLCMCGVIGSIGVLGTGKYAFCGIGESDESFIFGDAHKDKLLDVWNNTEMLKRIREELPSSLTGVCSDCLFKEGCLGTCVADNYRFSGDIFGPNRYCQSAWEEGYFPKSRLQPGSKHDLGYVEKPLPSLPPEAL